MLAAIGAGWSWVIELFCGVTDAGAVVFICAKCSYVHSGAVIKFKSTGFCVFVEQGRGMNIRIIFCLAFCRGFVDDGGIL